jgi:hypothetical protein
MNCGPAVASAASRTRLRHSAAGSVAFDPIDPAAQPHARPTTAIEDPVDIDFDADLRQLAPSLRSPP